MRLAAVLVVVLWSAPGFADPPPRLIQVVGIDVRTLAPSPGDEGRAVVFVSRATYSASPHTRGGLELGIGPMCLRSPLLKAHGASIDLDRESVFYHGGLVFGLAVGSAPLTAGAEIVVGASAVGAEVAPMLEPRLSAELWLAPDVTLGARLGSDLLRTSDLTAGLYLGIYTW